MSTRDSSNDVDFTSQDLSEWLKRHNYSANELAEMLGITRQAVVYWLSATRRIPEPIGRLLYYFDRFPEAKRNF